MNGSLGIGGSGAAGSADEGCFDGFECTGNVKDSFAVIGLRSQGLDFMADMVEVILEKLFGDEYRAAIAERNARNRGPGRL